MMTMRIRRAPSTMARLYFIIFALSCVWTCRGFVVETGATCTCRSSSLVAANNKPSAPSFLTPSSRTRLGLAENNDNNDGDDSPPETVPDGLPLNAVGYALAFVAFWPLLALVRIWSQDHLDIDSYMALKGMMETSDVPSMEEIRELPPLSPAEQMVGALFGPPSR